MTVYKPKAGHSKQPRGSSTMEDFFAWALELCAKGEGVGQIRIETPEFAVDWVSPTRAIEKRRTKKAGKR